ncbi:hypothetical protein QS257_17630 [Terrilactibacillus sp. S3-3]|nr:hypothetical protein QS257_17630 [Terrilactibacillus sp. S3-3]
MGETTIFEAQTLIAAMKARAKQYEALRGQFQHLRTAFQNITTLDDFKVKGRRRSKNSIRRRLM